MQIETGQLCFGPDGVKTMKLLNKSLTILAVGLGATAIAQSPVYVVSFGQGVAVNQANKRAEFNYEVGKKRNPDNTVVNVGRFSFNTVSENANDRIKIVFERPEVLGVNAAGTVCEFGGRAVLTRMTPQGRREIQGRADVRVEDKWNPTQGVEPPAEHPRDTIRVRFVVPRQNSTTPEVVFEFGGNVMRGNLAVRALPSNPGAGN